MLDSLGVPGETAQEVLVAIPAFEEELAIGSLVLRARTYAGEVLVVDDGSTDRTGEVAELASATVIRHRRNLGKGAALRTIFDYARRNSHDVLVLIDGDGQHNPEEIPTVVEPVLSGQADIAIGTRETKEDGMPPYRRVGKRSLDYLTAAISGLLTDSQSGFRAFSRRAIEELDVSSSGFGAESETLLRATQSGLTICEIPIRSRYDIEGSTLPPVEHAYGVIGALLRFVAYKHPLFFFCLPGLVLFLVGAYLASLTLHVYNQTGAFLVGYALLVAIFLLGGSVTTFTGILLNVLPQAVVERQRTRI